MQYFISGTHQQTLEMIKMNQKLSTVVIELGNQLTAQTTINNTITDIITEIENQITELTAVNEKLVAVNIRALDNTDIPHEPLPYNMKIIGEIQSNILEETINFTFTDSDWGSGLDFYVYGIYIRISASLYFAKPMAIAGEGMKVDVYTDVGGEGTTFKYMYGENWNDSVKYPFFDKSDNYWVFYGFKKIDTTKVNSDDELIVRFNNSASQLAAGTMNFRSYILGVPK